MLGASSPEVGAVADTVFAETTGLNAWGKAMRFVHRAVVALCLSTIVGVLCGCSDRSVTKLANVAMPEDQALEITGKCMLSGKCLLYGGLIIHAGAELLVRPGTTLEFKYSRSWVVNHGKLTIEGTAEQPVVISGLSSITCLPEKLPGGTGLNDWLSWGIKYDEASSISIRHARIEMGGHALEALPPAPASLKGPMGRRTPPSWVPRTPWPVRFVAGSVDIADSSITNLKKGKCMLARAIKLDMQRVSVRFVDVAQKGELNMYFIPIESWAGDPALIGAHRALIRECEFSGITGPVRLLTASQGLVSGCVFSHCSLVIFGIAPISGCAFVKCVISLVKTLTISNCVFNECKFNFDGPGASVDILSCVLVRCSIAASFESCSLLLSRCPLFSCTIPEEVRRRAVAVVGSDGIVHWEGCDGYKVPRTQEQFEALADAVADGLRAELGIMLDLLNWAIIHGSTCAESETIRGDLERCVALFGVAEVPFQEEGVVE